MAEHQKIHPVQDPEAPQGPTAPLVPPGATKSEIGDPGVQQPPIRRTLPVQYSKPPKRRGCCCRCLCWTMCLLLLLIVAIGATLGILYLVFQPKLPEYSIDALRITQFNMTNDLDLHATFNVDITARNPNKKIGIYYEGGSHLSASYMGTRLAEGPLPRFYQGHQNTTVLDVVLTGHVQNATDLISSLQVQQQTGSIPLNLRVRAPVRIKLGALRLMEVRPLVRCNLVVDSLTTDNVIRIQRSSCTFRFRF